MGSSQLLTLQKRFIRWRAGLMELAVQKLDLASATTAIPLTLSATEIDPYQMVQVHDYLNVSFLRPDPLVRACTKKTIEVLSTAYPELLREKFFVNVPAIMGWMFAAVKLFVSKETVRKFHPISNGANLANEIEFGEKIPKAYGGQGEYLVAVGQQLSFETVAPATTKITPEIKPDATAEEAKSTEVKAEATADPKTESKDTPIEAAAAVKPETSEPAAAEPAVGDKPATVAA